MCNRIRPHAGELAALCLACAAAIYFFSSAIAPNATRLTHGFVAYYTIAQMVREGQADARIYDDTWFRTQTARVSRGAADDIFNANPPTLALLFLPLAFFPPDVARALWTGVNVVLLGGAFILLTHVNRLSRPCALLLGAFFLCAAPLAENFRLGQTYVLLLFLFALSLFLWQREKQFASGVALGMAGVLKIAGVLVWLMFLARRETRVLVGGAIAILAGFLLSLPFVGVETWRVYFVQALPALVTNPAQSVTAYQTLTGFLQHLFRYDARLNAFPVWDAPRLALALYLVLGVLMASASVYFTRAFPKVRAFAVFVTLSVMLAPVAEEYHFVLLLLPVFVYAGTIRSLREKSFLIFLIALGLLALPFPYKAPQLAAGWSALLAYPRLYSALLLWGLLVLKK